MATEINIDNIEGGIKDRLDLKLAAPITAGDLEVEVLPDEPGGFRRPIKKKGRISIGYMDTDFDRTISPEVVAQPGFNKFGFFLASRTRRGPYGINGMIALVLKWLVGFKPLGHEKLTAVKIELYQRETDTNLWLARVELSAKYMLVEFNDDPEPNKITEITFNPPGYGGDAVVVNANTVTPEYPPAQP